jgi:hypothetical protein
MTLWETITVIAVPVLIKSASILFKRKYLFKVFYLLKPQSAVLKARIKLLTVGEQINYNGNYRNRDDVTFPVTIYGIGKNTINVLGTYVFPKKYIRFLSNGELVLIDFDNH